MTDNISLNYSIATSKGIRSINEDTGWISKNKNNQYLMIVCDGIGSQDDSQIASAIAVDVFKTAFQAHKRIFNIDYFFNKCLKKAYTQISKIASQKLNNKKIGTTLVVTFIDKNKATTYNLGDSRVYRYSFSTDSWTQITRDHNLYNYFLDIAETIKLLT